MAATRANRLCTVPEAPETVAESLCQAATQSAPDIILFIDRYEIIVFANQMKDSKNFPETNFAGRVRFVMVAELGTSQHKAGSAPL